MKFNISRVVYPYNILELFLASLLDCRLDDLFSFTLLYFPFIDYFLTLVAYPIWYFVQERGTSNCGSRFATIAINNQQHNGFVGGAAWWVRGVYLAADRDLPDLALMGRVSTLSHISRRREARA
jgi:hypothetical protein